MGIVTGLHTRLTPEAQARNDEKTNLQLTVDAAKVHSGLNTFHGAGDGNRTRVISLEG